MVAVAVLSLLAVFSYQVIWPGPTRFSGSITDCP